MFSYLEGEVVVDPPVLALGDQVLDVATNDLTEKYHKNQQINMFENRFLTFLYSFLLSMMAGFLTVLWPNCFFLT